MHGGANDPYRMAIVLNIIKAVVAFIHFSAVKYTLPLIYMKTFVLFIADGHVHCAVRSSNKNHIDYIFLVQQTFFKHKLSLFITILP